jgi:hypothetical protein
MLRDRGRPPTPHRTSTGALRGRSRWKGRTRDLQLGRRGGPCSALAEGGRSAHLGLMSCANLAGSGAVCFGSKRRQEPTLISRPNSDVRTASSDAEFWGPFGLRH